jgi:hypothetical protein
VSTAQDPKPTYAVYRGAMPLCSGYGHALTAAERKVLEAGGHRVEVYGKAKPQKAARSKEVLHGKTQDD